MTRARSLSKLSNPSAFTVDTDNNVGVNSTSPVEKLNVVGVVSATSFFGDGTGLTGVASTDNIITGTAATFNSVVKVGTGITLDPTSGIITATTFTGNFTGSVTGVATEVMNELKVAAGLKADTPLSSTGTGEVGQVDSVQALLEGYGYNVKMIEEAVAIGRADKQVNETVSYFRAKERERLNPGGVGGAQINPKFSQPSSLLDKLGKFGMSFDPQDPDTFYDQAERVPVDQVTENFYDTSRRIGDMSFIEQTSRYAKGTPMPKTVAGVNQELQAVKARTRDAAMEFRGRVYDYIDDIKAKTLDYADSEVAEYFGKSDEYALGQRRMPLSYGELQDKYFPDEATGSVTVDIPLSDEVFPVVTVFPVERVVFEPLHKGFNVAKTLLGLSSVFVSVPPPTVKLLPLPDWSVTELPSFKIK